MFNAYLFTIVYIYQHHQCQYNEWQKGHYTEYAQPNEPLQPLTTDTVGRHINGQDKTTLDINRHIKHIKHIKQHRIDILDVHINKDILVDILVNSQDKTTPDPSILWSLSILDIITSSHQIPQFFGAFPQLYE